MLKFHNTINIQGEEKKAAVASVSHQEVKVLAFFTVNPGKAYTPDEVHATLNLQGVPLTSIRRAITNLTNERALVKTKDKKIGRYGAYNYMWMLNSRMFKGRQQPLFV